MKPMSLRSLFKVELYLLLILAMVPNQCQSTRFDPNCAIPTEDSNLVLSPNIRGTFDILWSSLFTIVSCTWTVQHLNVPWQDPSSRESLWAIIIGIASSLWVKIKWMITTIILPEFLVGKALQDRHRAKTPDPALERIAIRSGFRWTKTHSFYADMGGFVLKAKSDYRGQVVQTPVYLNLASLAYVCREDGVNVNPGDAEPGLSNKEKTSGSLIDKLPTVTENDIKDKSKDDLFIKLLTLLQVSWSVVQAIVRGARGLHISQLEITVIAYAACTFVTYVLCLSKPKGVGVPTTVPVKRGLHDIELTMDDANHIRDCLPRSWFYTSLRLFRHNQRGDGAQHDGHQALLQPISNDARYDNTPSAIFPGASLLTLMDDGFLIAGLVFGGIHCAAWNFPFPTPVEQLLWRIASLLSAGLLPLFYGVLLYDIHVKGPRLLRLPLPAFKVIFTLGFVLARLYLIVEVFRSLFYLPPSAFVGTWTAHIPHVS
ncbi:hypothetical protein Neosp_014064 [[Neocosmospora] mangrovei]